MPGPVIIPTRFCGPPDRGNGGITAGMLAAHIDGAAEITLRRPSPLATPMHVGSGAAGVVLRDGDDVVAEGVADDRRRRRAPARCRSRKPRTRPRRRRWCCIPSGTRSRRASCAGRTARAGDGLRVLPGRVGSRPLFAAPVRFPADLAGAAGEVPAELLWAALDCPSSFVMYMDGVRPTKAYVLGRIAARIDRQPPIDATLVALSWPLGLDGRKLFAGERAVRRRRARRRRPRHLDQRLRD